MMAERPVQLLAAHLLAAFLRAIGTRPSERPLLCLLSSTMMFFVALVISALGSAWPARAASLMAAPLTLEQVPVVIFGVVWTIISGLMAVCIVAVQLDLTRVSQRLWVATHAEGVTFWGRELDVERAEVALSHLSAFLSLLLVQVLLAVSALLMVTFG